MAKQMKIRTVDGKTVTWSDTKYDIQDTDDKIIGKDKEDGSVTTVMKKWIVAIHEDFQ